MKFDRLVRPSDQVDIIIPEWIREQYPRFVEFMGTALQAEERQGFAADILQNLLKYRDFDYYKGKIVFHNYLNAELDFSETESLVLIDGEGFPKENGILMIEDEIILYRYREGNIFYELQRGSSGTSNLGTFLKDNTYESTLASIHAKNTPVTNLSTLFLQTFITNIFDTYADGIDKDWVNEDINRGQLLENIKDFFQSKGSKLGIQALFKILFGETDVDVFYPGDRMINPSESTYIESFILRVEPLPEVLVNMNTYIPPERLLATGTALQENVVDDPTAVIVRSYNSNFEVAVISPERLLNREIVLKSYNDLYDPKTKDRVYGRAICDYVTAYEHEDQTQYEMYVQKKYVEGNFLSNPRTELIRDLETTGSADDRIDVFTVTVNSTIGFPDEGVLFIDNEAIYYRSKSWNQFHDCVRGYIGVESFHDKGSMVNGPYYIEGTYTAEEAGREFTYTSRSWPLGLVEKINIKDGGVLHQKDDKIYVNGPGRIEPREPILESIVENPDGKLVTQSALMPNMKDVENIAYGVQGTYFDDNFVFVASSNFPGYQIGRFSSDDSVGPYMETPTALHVVPRQTNLKQNRVSDTEFHFDYKGTGPIGVFCNGTTAMSNVSTERAGYGKIYNYRIVNGGRGYVTPTIFVDGVKSTEDISINEVKGAIVGVTTKSNKIYKNFLTLPEVTVTSGRGAKLEVILDEYGRCLEVKIIDKGEYYYDTPIITLNDRSKKGRGAQLTCRVNKWGKITKVIVENGGIDYNTTPGVTEALVTPIGSGAQILAEVQYYQLDRYQQVVQKPEWSFDEGAGFLWEKGSPSYTFVQDGITTKTATKIYSHYGYISEPIIMYGIDYNKVRRIRTDKGPQLITHEPEGPLGYQHILTNPFRVEDQHSPIMGWAYDGCPIYGPLVYTNGLDHTDGVKFLFSGYVKRPNRETIIPGGGGELLETPSVQDYPMGTFVEDYVYDPAEVYKQIEEIVEELVPSAYRKALGRTRRGLKLARDGEPEDSYDFARFAILNENNAIKMNTPDFPKELYPDGVWCYIATAKIYTNEPQFPYLVGKTFELRPVTQNTKTILNDEPDAIPFLVWNPTSDLREAPIQFDFNKAIRHRTPYLPDTNDEIRLNIEHLSKGSVSEVEVVDGLPYSTKVGDLVYFSNEDAGGSGASAIVTEIEGVPIEKGFTKRTLTSVISHYQRLNIGTDVYDPELHGDLPPGAFVFYEGQIITTTSKAEAIILRWDYENEYLDVHTYTKNLILPGDAFKDAKNRWCVLNTGIPGASESIVTEDGKIVTLENSQALFTNTPGVGAAADINWWTLNKYRSRQTRSIIGYSEPGALDIDTRLEPGDLYWSKQTGRMYVYYKSPSGYDWVCTQPIGMRPLVGASDESIGNSKVADNINWGNQPVNLVIISSKHPSKREDGTPIQVGDLWWSPHGGLLYSFVDGQWVVATPNAVVPTASASDYEIDYDPDSHWNLGVYEEHRIEVIISGEAPTESIDGAPLKVGMLWWSPITGKMYIRFRDSNGTNVWVVANPVAWVTTSFGMNEIPDGDGGGSNNRPPVIPLPIPPVDGDNDDNTAPLLKKYEVIFWFDHLKDFHPGDKIRIQSGVPGDATTELCEIERILVTGSPASAVIKRGDPSLLIPDGSEVENASKYEYIIDCEVKHNVRLEDKITIYGSKYEFLNGTHSLDSTGIVLNAEATTEIADGSVTAVNVTVPGAGYTADFEVFFYGGNGFQGSGIAVVNPNEGGYVESVRITNPGYSYETPPDVWFGDNLTDTQMMFYTTEYFEEETTIAYKTDSPVLMGPAATVEMLFGGYNYSSMPKILGLYNKAVDRAEFMVDLSYMAGLDGEGLPIMVMGTTITGVRVLQGGNRYNNPKVEFIDLQGSGYGAKGRAVVEFGKIIEIEVLDGGYDYLEPVCFVYDDSGKYIALTEDIGSIKEISVLDPGRSIVSDATIQPEIMIDTRVIVEFEMFTRGSMLAVDGPANITLLQINGGNGEIIDPNQPINEFDDFVVGEELWQGTEDGKTKLVTAILIDYDDERQILTLRDVSGTLKEGDFIYGENGKKGRILREGQTDARMTIKGIAKPKGRFIDDKSVLSTRFANIQDSYYYQWFSYSIASPLQQRQFDDFVSQLIHPTGFVMFSDVTVRSQAETDLFVYDPVIAGPTLPILSPDGYNVQYTALSPYGYPDNPAMSPNTGDKTLE